MSQFLNSVHFAVCREVGVGINGVQGAYYPRDKITLPSTRYLAVILKEARQREQSQQEKPQQP
jgi:hypothetical protein